MKKNNLTPLQFWDFSDKAKEELERIKKKSTLEFNGLKGTITYDIKDESSS